MAGLGHGPVGGCRCGSAAGGPSRGIDGGRGSSERVGASGGG